MAGEHEEPPRLAPAPRAARWRSGAARQALAGAFLETVRRAGWAPLLVLALHAPLSAAGLDLYDTHTWLDIPMHILGGVAITVFFERGSKELHRTGLPMPRGASRVLILLGCTLGAALAWELLEFSADQLFGAGAQRGAADTLGDIANGILGGGLWLALRALARPVR